jgi:hypothetical protein
LAAGVGSSNFTTSNFKTFSSKMALADNNQQQPTNSANTLENEQITTTTTTTIQ